MEEEAKGDFFQSPPEYQSRLTKSGGNSSAKRYVIIISSIVVIGLLIFGVTRFFSGGSENQDSTPTPTIEAFPTDIPEPTIEEETTPTEAKKEPTNTPAPTKKPSTSSVDITSGLDRAKLSIHVLNGSGTAGASKIASDYLEGLGYNVIQIGNAENFDYTQTEIQIISSQSKYLSLLKKDLSSKYSVGATSGTPPADSQADAVVIVGKE